MKGNKKEKGGDKTWQRMFLKSSCQNHGPAERFQDSYIAICNEYNGILTPIQSCGIFLNKGISFYTLMLLNCQFKILFLKCIY